MQATTDRGELAFLAEMHSLPITAGKYLQTNHNRYSIP